MKKILITGANSYIGNAVRDYLLQEPDKYIVQIIDTIGWTPQKEDFLEWDVVFNVAGIVHIKETADNRHLYYDINRDLVVEIAKRAKEGGVKQFILLSTMSVYGKDIGHITKQTIPSPINSYGKSKLEADEEIRKLEDEEFCFACVRPPMVYGKNCKGNYQSLRKFALKSPVFPNYDNNRSMIYIGNLCEFIKKCIDEKKSGLFFPQNAEYVRTSNMVKLIAETNGEKVGLTKLFNWAIRIIPLKVVNKVFGNLTYEKDDVIEKYGFDESIKMTEQ